jgi:hypothetical protein
MRWHYLANKKVVSCAGHMIAVIVLTPNLIEMNHLNNFTARSYLKAILYSC